MPASSSFPVGTPLASGFLQTLKAGLPLTPAFLLYETKLQFHPRWSISAGRFWVPLRELPGQARQPGPHDFVTSLSGTTLLSATGFWLSLSRDAVKAASCDPRLAV